MGALTNINQEGFAAQAFHAWPDTMQWDTYSSDYGSGLLGHMISSTTYLVESPKFGFLSFGGNVQEDGEVVTVQPRDTVRRKIYVAPMGLKLKIDAGTIEQFTFHAATGKLIVKVGAAGSEGGRSAEIEWEDTLGKGVKSNSGPILDLPGVLEFTV